MTDEAKEPEEAEEKAERELEQKPERGIEVDADGSMSATITGDATGEPLPEVEEEDDGA